MYVRSVKGAFDVQIDRYKCIGCLLCVRACPVNALEGRLKQPYPSPYAAFEEKCVGCRNCQDVCPTKAVKVLPAEPEEFIKGPWTFDAIDDIRERAKTGKSLVQGCGSNRRLPTFDDLIVIPAQLTASPLDKYRESCNAKTVIGDSSLVEKPLELATPIVVGAMSYGALSKEAKIAIAKGASAVKTATNTGEGGMLPEERENATRLIAQYSTGRFGVSADYLRAADAVEIKIGQGAKPGMGGHLLAMKVTKEIAEIRRIPMGTDSLSPARHLDMHNEDDLTKHIELIREVTDYRIPVLVKLAGARVKEDVQIAARAGADAITLDGMQGGTGAAPSVAIQHGGIPTIAIMRQAVDGLEEIGLKDEVALILSGGIRNGADVAKALALGANAVGIATGVMIALGCHVCGQCSKGECRWGIATQDPELRKCLDADEGAQAVANYLKAVTEELKTLTMLAGKDDVHKLTKEDLRALSLDASAITGVKLIGLEKIVGFDHTQLAILGRMERVATRPNV